MPRRILPVLGLAAGLAVALGLGVDSGVPVILDHTVGSLTQEDNAAVKKGVEHQDYHSRTLSSSAHGTSAAGGGHGQCSSSSAHPLDLTRGGIFIMFSLFAGVVLILVMNVLHIPLPYTVVLLLVGLAFGVWMKVPHENGLEILGDSMNYWACIDPHVFVFIFLPALLYEAAGSVDIHIFGRAGTQIMLLAGPGVVISTFLTAAVAKYAFDYGWTWPIALTFGAMMSATDPVAVVALLKELGASKRLALLIEGESLFNDGTAMVVFLLFQSTMAADAAPLTGEKVVVSFIRLAGGGTVLGWLMGQVAVIAIANIIDDASLEITITLTAAYGAFFLAESSVLGFSGVLATVIFGLTMSYHGKTAISPTVEHFMHEFWEMLGFLANTIIFALSGLIMVAKYHDESIRSYDWGLVFGLWAALNVIRAFVIWSLSPLLRRSGYGLDFGSACVISWGGLRGAVGLALAMMVEHDEKVDKRVRQLFLFHMAGIAILTLVVNGSTTGMLVRYLKLHKGSCASRKLFENAVSHLDHKTSEAVDTLKHNAFFSDADWTAVWNALPVCSEQVYARRKKNVPGFAPKESTMNKYFRRLDDAYFTTGEESAMGRKEVLKTASAHNRRYGSAGGKAKQGDGMSADYALSPQRGGSPGRRATVSNVKLVKEQVRAVTEDEDAMVEAMYLQAVRHTYFNLLKAAYNHQNDTGFTGANAHKALVGAANRAEDAAMECDLCDVPLDEWKFVKPFLSVPTFSPLFLFGLMGRGDTSTSNMKSMLALPLVGHVCRHYLEKHLALRYDVCRSFIYAHQETAEQFTHLLAAGHHGGHGDGHGDGHGHAAGHAHGDGDGDHGLGMLDQASQAACRQILQASELSIAQAQAALDETKEEYPDIATALATKAACYTLLEDMRTHAEELQHHGELEDKEFQLVSHALLKARKKLHFQFGRDVQQRFSLMQEDSTGGGSGCEVLEQQKFYRCLEPPALRGNLEIQCKSICLSRGDTLFEEGDSAEGVFFVVRGTVLLYVPQGAGGGGAQGGAGGAAGGEFLHSRPLIPGKGVGGMDLYQLGNGEAAGVFEYVLNTHTRQKHTRRVTAVCEGPVQVLHVGTEALSAAVNASATSAAADALCQDAALLAACLHLSDHPRFARLLPAQTRMLLANAKVLELGESSKRDGEEVEAVAVLCDEFLQQMHGHGQAAYCARDALLLTGSVVVDRGGVVCGSVGMWEVPSLRQAQRQQSRGQGCSFSAGTTLLLLPDPSILVDNSSNTLRGYGYGGAGDGIGADGGAEGADGGNVDAFQALRFEPGGGGGENRRSSVFVKKARRPTGFPNRGISD